MHKCDDDGGDGGNRHHLLHLHREMQEKENCNIGINWKRGGSQLDLLPFIELKSVWLKQLTWQVVPFETPQQGFGMVYLACQFSCRHTRYITFVLLCLTQTNKPSLRLSISPKKGYVVKFSTVATEWSRVHRSQGNGFGNIWREFIDLQGVHFKTSFALWRFQVPSRFVQVTQYPAS